MKVIISSDHSGVGLKKEIENFLKAKKIDVESFGAVSVAPTDYPDFVRDVTDRVLSDKSKQTFGIVICGTGVGISIAANKVKGIYAALCSNPEIAFFARSHNDCNVLALGARYTAKTTALKIVDAFLSTAFEGGRHVRRVNKILDIEKVNGFK